MLYGEYSLSPNSENDTLRNRLKSAIEWEESSHHSVELRGFLGGFFIDKRLPFKADECVYVNTANDLLVLISGCIYNQEELCAYLGIALPFSVSVPALLAQLYLLKGAGFVNDLNGDFAIAICQPAQNTIMLFRDHIGVAPLAYISNGDSLCFSSDIISLCRTFSEGEKMNIDPFIGDYKLTDMTLTPNHRVMKLLPGHYLKCDLGGIHIVKYWQPERIQTDKSLTKQQMLAELRSLLEDSVHIRSDQRFVAGAHLSGGLDSSTIAVLARKNYNQQSRFYGYSWTPENATPEKDELDERELVKKTAGMARIIPAFIRMEVSDFVQLTKNALKSFNYLFEEKVLEIAKAHKTNLMFSGYGGDEFISFGSLGLDSDLFFSLQWKTFFQRNPLTKPLVLVKRLVYRVLFPAINFVPFSVIKSYDKAMCFFKKEYRVIDQKNLKRYYCYRSRRGYQLGLLDTYHISERTECWSITGFRNGVVYRYPLLDKRIIEYVLKIPSKILVEDTEYTRIILREITEGLLPEEVRWRRGKRDPAFFSLVDKDTRERALLFIDEVAEFKANPNLNFIDFSLLEREVYKFKTDLNFKNSRKLCGDILAFKILHEITKSYHEPIES